MANIRLQKDVELLPLADAAVSPLYAGFDVDGVITQTP